MFYHAWGRESADGLSGWRACDLAGGAGAAKSAPPAIRLTSAGGREPQGDTGAACYQVNRGKPWVTPGVRLTISHFFKNCVLCRF